MSTLSARISQLHHGQGAQIALAARLIYFPIPKAANSFMRRWVNTLECSVLFGNAPTISGSQTYDPQAQYCHTLAQLPGGIRATLKAEDFELVTVVRDPYMRVLSAYLDKRRDGAGGPITGKLPRGSWRTFPDFLDALSRRDYLFADGHWAPQSWLVAPVRPLIRRILHTETLGSDLDELVNTLGLPDVTVMPDQLQHWTRALELRNEFLDQDTRSAIEELYAADFEFGYQMEP